MVEKHQGTLRICAADQRAQAEGLSVGLKLADARSRHVNLCVENMDRVKDAALLERLAGLCEFFTPLFSLDGDQGLMMDITGCAHLFGDEFGFYRAVAERFKRTQVTCRMAIASTPDAARAFARHSNMKIVPHEHMEAQARGLSVDALEISSDIKLALKRAGLRTCDDLLNRPSQILSARFGAHSVHQLHRMCGREDVRITPLRTPPDCVAERQFATPLMSMDGIVAAFGMLADLVVHQMDIRGQGGRVFEGALMRTDGTVRRIFVETAEPVRDPQTLLTLIKLRLEGLADPLDPGFGFDGLRLCALHLQAYQTNQLALDGRADKSRDISNLLNQYGVKFGRHRVSQFVLYDTHDPSRQSARISILDQAPMGTTDQIPDLPRPLTLFDHPHPIDALAEVPDGPPLRFRWRRILHDVARAEGPERIAPEWWQCSPQRQDRDYYRVEDTQGHRFWVFREGFYGQSHGEPRWYVHGLFA